VVVVVDATIIMMVKLVMVGNVVILVAYLLKWDKRNKY